MNINLSKRYPNSRTEDLTEAFEHGFEAGYKMGYDVGFNQLLDEYKELQDKLQALFDIWWRGEATNED